MLHEGLILLTLDLPRVWTECSTMHMGMGGVHVFFDLDSGPSVFVRVIVCLYA